jgi:hypothetical protein
MGTPVRTQPWPEIIEFYRSISWAGPMAELAEAIAGSRHGAELYASTSMHTLLVTQTPEFEWDEGVLRIEPVIEGPPYHIPSVRFEFAEAPHVRERWCHTYPSREAFAAFERFIERAHWFVEYRPAE